MVHACFYVARVYLYCSSHAFLRGMCAFLRGTRAVVCLYIVGVFFHVVVRVLLHTYVRVCTDPARKLMRT